MLSSPLTRRALLGQSARGLGAVALASLLNERAAAESKWRGVVTTPHVPPKAKRVIWLYMAGGMSHLETWDPKPKLAEMHGKPMPESVTAISANPDRARAPTAIVVPLGL